MSHEHSGVWNHQQLNCLFSILFRWKMKKRQRSFVRGILQSLMDSPHKGPVTQNIFPLHHILGCCIKPMISQYNVFLSTWGRVTHICVSKQTVIGPDNGLSPGRRQAIIGTNVGVLLNQNLGANFSEILSQIQTFSFKKMQLKMSSAKWRPYCLGLNVLISSGWSHYNIVNFLQNTHNRHTTVHLRGQHMACIMWIHSLIYVLQCFTSHISHM